MTSVERPLYEKYTVFRNDGKDCTGGPRENARYFVLDYVHDPYARRALSEYAGAIIENANPPEAGRDRHPLVPHLAGDLLHELIETEPAHRAHMDSEP